MADKKDPISAHNPQFEAESDDIQENTEDGINMDKDKVTEVETISLSSNQDNEEEAADSLSPMRKEWIPRDTTSPEGAEDIGKLKTIIEFEAGDTGDKEIAEHDAVEIKTVEPLETSPAEVPQDQASEMHEEAQVQENGHTIDNVQEEYQQSTEIQNQQNGTDVMDLPIHESKSEEEDEREKIMPKEIREKVSSVVPALLKVAENDKHKCCCCNCDVKCTVNCLNTCCLPCNNPFRKSQDAAKQTTSFEIFNETLQKGSEAGRAIFQEIIFPLIRPFTRDIIAISEFLVGLLGLILSIVSLTLGNNAAYNILHLVLAILSTLLGFTDMVVSLKFSAAFAKVIKKLRNRNHIPDQAQATNDTEAQNPNQKDEHSKEPSFLKKGWDTGRILISEAILYPLLVCDLIEFIVDKGYEVNEPTDIVNLILFIISLVSLIFYVYIVRLAVLIAMVVHLQKCRTLEPKQKEALVAKWSTENEILTEKGEELDPDAARKARNFQIYFILHVMGQMAAQIMMIVAVSLKIADDNRNRTLESPLRISNELWFMLVAGYIMPFLGILSFFVPTFYWVYEHENGLCLDFLSLLNMPGIDHVLYPDGDDMKEAYESIRKIASKLNEGNKLRESFENLRNIDFGKKVGYAFRNPFLVVSCLGYSFAQLAFVVVAIVGIQNETLGTIIYYILSIVIGILANVYVFLVAALWTAVIVGILVAVASVIALIAGICFLFMAGQTCQSNSNRNVTY